jgi:hypothetical protein
MEMELKDGVGDGEMVDAGWSWSLEMENHEATGDAEGERRLT